MGAVATSIPTSFVGARSLPLLTTVLTNICGITASPPDEKERALPVLAQRPLLSATAQLLELRGQRLDRSEDHLRAGYFDTRLGDVLHRAGALRPGRERLTIRPLIASITAFTSFNLATSDTSDF